MSNELNTTVNKGYEVMVTPDGKYVRKAVYEAFSSVIAETREQKINLMNLLDSDDAALPLKDNVGIQIEVADVILQPYDSIDENTGEITSGVLTYLITPGSIAYVTSSKSVYFTVKKIMQVFGEPHWNEEETVTLEVVQKKGQQFKYIDVKLVG